LPTSGKPKYFEWGRRAMAGKRVRRLVPAIVFEIAGPLGDQTQHDDSHRHSDVASLTLREIVPNSHCKAEQNDVSESPRDCVIIMSSLLRCQPICSLARVVGEKPRSGVTRFDPASVSGQAPAGSHLDRVNLLPRSIQKMFDGPVCGDRLKLSFPEESMTQSNRPI
jgi:hypothetical protein